MTLGYLLAVKSTILAFTLAACGGGGSGGSGGSAPLAHSVKLSWTIPTTRVDGTPLSAGELSGYDVYYNNGAGNVVVIMPVAGGATTETVVSGLSTGTYHFAVSAVDSFGQEGPLSNQVSISLP